MSKITFQKSNIGIMRAYEDNLMIGSTSWLMATKQPPFIHEGWLVYSRHVPKHPKLTSHVFYFAIKQGWTQDQIDFHIYDHNVATSREEVLDCIKYWNEHPDEMEEVES